MTASGNGFSRMMEGEPEVYSSAHTGSLKVTAVKNKTKQKQKQKQKKTQAGHAVYSFNPSTQEAEANSVSLRSA